MWHDTRSVRAWWRVSATAPCGAGCTKTLSGPGSIAAGYFRAIRSSNSRPRAYWTVYERRWQGQPLRLDEFVISTDEKTSIQARLRIHPSLPTAPGASMRVEHEYARGGAWAYLAALDVHRAKVFGRCEATTGIAPFERLVDLVMSQPP